VRSILLLVHRWTGLLLAVYAVVIGLTGSVLVYHEELAAVLRPAVQGGAVPAAITTSPDEALALTRRQLPGWQPLSVTWPHEHNPHFSLYCLKGREARIAFVRADAAQWVGAIDPRADFVGWVEALHANLLVPRTGRLVNGYAAVLTMVLVLTGLVVWWPVRAQWRTWVRLSGRRSWWRVPWDLHHALGVAAAGFLLVLAFTGAYFTWSQAYIRTVSAVLPRFVEPKLPTGEVAGRATLAQVAEAARQAVPGRPILRLAVVEKPVRPVAVTMLHGAADEIHRVSTVYVDPRDGRVLGVKRLAERPAGDTAIGMFATVHFGRFGGGLVRLLWFTLGVVTAVLAVTGVLMWWRGLRRLAA